MSPATIILAQLAVATLSGWLITRLAIRYLLNTYIPAQQKTFAAGLGAKAAQTISLNALAMQLRNPALLDEMRPGIEEHVNTFLHVKLKEKIPVLSMFMGESTMDKVKAGLLEEIDLLLPQVIGQYADKLGQHIDIASLVEEKVASLPPDRFKATFTQSLSPLTTKAPLFGALLGLTCALLSTLTGILSH